MALQDIIPNGTTVVTKRGKIEATVTGVCVRGKRNDYVEYNISYFKNGEHTSIWLHDFEVEIKRDNSAPAGFRSDNKPKLTRGTERED